MKKAIMVIALSALSFSGAAFSNQIQELHDRVDETWDKVSSVQDEAREMNADTNKALVGVQETLHSEGVIRAEGDRIVAANAQKKLDAESGKLQGYLNQVGDAFQAQANQTASEIARVDGRIDSLEKKTDKLKAGVAGANAIGSLSQYMGHGTHHVAVGIGGYEGASALAGGYTYAISQSTTVRVTVAYDSEGDFGYGASVGHSW